MKIVDYNTFTNMPEGTVYCTTEPIWFGDLCVKHNTIISNGENIDWFYSDLVGNPEYNSDIYEEAFKPMQEGKDIEPDFVVQQRDGMYDYDRTFMVYNKKDIQDMINTLKLLV